MGNTADKSLLKRAVINRALRPRSPPPPPPPAAAAAAARTTTTPRATTKTPRTATTPQTTTTPRTTPPRTPTPRTTKPQTTTPRKATTPRTTTPTTPTTPTTKKTTTRTPRGKPSGRSTSAQPQQLHLGLFEIGRPLGKGRFGRVYLVRHRESGFICALKVLEKGQITRENAEANVRREIEVHSNLRQPGILGFYNWFHDSRRIYLVLEYAAGGELYRQLRQEGRFPERRAARYAAQVASALRYLHSKNVMHRDIKPENILVGLYGELKLADFGYSVHSAGNRRGTLCGTLDYLPPEMLASKKPAYSRAVDQWTLGVLTYEFLTGEPPFEDSAPMTKRRIVRGDMKPLPASISQEAKDFVHSLLVLDPAKRLSLDDALRHPWIIKHCCS